jgi:hypothetical protein
VLQQQSGSLERRWVDNNKHLHLRPGQLSNANNNFIPGVGKARKHSISIWILDEGVWNSFLVHCQRHNSSGQCPSGVFLQGKICLSLFLFFLHVHTSALSLVFSLCCLDILCCLFVYQLKLPAAEADRVLVHVECTTGTTLVIARKAMRQDQGNSSPGKTVAHSLRAAIGQSVSGIGQENMLSISLRTNFDLRVCPPPSSPRCVSHVLMFNPDLQYQ